MDLPEESVVELAPHASPMVSRDRASPFMRYKPIKFTTLFHRGRRGQVTRRGSKCPNRWTVSNALDTWGPDLEGRRISRNPRQGCDGASCTHCSRVAAFASGIRESDIQIYRTLYPRAPWDPTFRGKRDPRTILPGKGADGGGLMGFDLVGGTALMRGCLNMSNALSLL